MSLEDELKSAVLKKLSIDEWVANWLSTLPPKDKKLWAAWVVDPRIEAASMYRVIRKHGFPHAESSFRHWRSEQRRST